MCAQRLLRETTPADRLEEVLKRSLTAVELDSLKRNKIDAVFAKIVAERVSPCGACNLVLTERRRSLADDSGAGGP